MTTDIVTHVRVRWPKCIPSYPSNGRMPTKWVVRLGDDKRWRRVYDRCAEAASYTDDGTIISARFVPVVRGLDGEFRDLTTDESAFVGYDFHEARWG